MVKILIRDFGTHGDLWYKEMMDHIVGQYCQRNLTRLSSYGLVLHRYLNVVNFPTWANMILQLHLSTKELNDCLPFQGVFFNCFFTRALAGFDPTILKIIEIRANTQLLDHRHCHGPLDDELTEASRHRAVPLQSVANDRRRSFQNVILVTLKRHDRAAQVTFNDAIFEPSKYDLVTSTP